MLFEFALNTIRRTKRHAAAAGLLYALSVGAHAQSFSASPVVFPPTGDNAQSPQQVNITLTAASTVRSIAIPLPLAAQPEFFLVDNGGCVEDGTTVNAAGTVCSVVVRFHAHYAGVRTASLVVTDGVGKSIAVPLTGTGVYPQIAVSPAATRIAAGIGPANAAFTGDGDAATLASLTAPHGVAADSFGNLFIADTGNNAVRMLDAFGNITTVAGGGAIAGAAADGGQATSASLVSPTWLAVDPAGNLYIAETGSHVIRRVAMSTSRTITTVAGSYVAGTTGDNGPATAARINAPTGIDVDANGNLFIADSGNHRVRRVDAATGSISAFAGTGEAGFNSASTASASAQFGTLAAIKLDPLGNLLIADSSNHALRKISAGSVTVIAGTGVAGSAADGTVAATAALGDPEGLALTPSGDIYFTDAAAGLVRKIRSADGTLETVVATAGKSNGFTAGVRPSNSVSLNAPLGLAFDPRFTLFIADSANNVVRSLSPSPAEANFAARAVGDTSSPVTIRVANIGNAPLPLAGITAQNTTTSSNFTLNTATADPCGTTLAAASRCSFNVSFSPAGSGSVTGEFDVSYLRFANAGSNVIAQVFVTGGTQGVVAISPGSLSPIIQGQSVSTPITATGALGTVTLDLEGALPAGMSVSVSGAVLTLSGTPAAAGSFPLTVFAIDALGATATQTYVLQVLPSNVTLSVTEAVQVTDTVSSQLSLSLAVTEAIHVVDAPAELPSLSLNLTEAVHVTDTPSVIPSLTLAITEAVHVADTPGVIPSLTLAIAEAVHVTDVNTDLPSLSLAVTEGIQVTDVVNLSASLAPQTITPPTVPAHTYGDANFTINPTSSSGLAVTSTVQSGPATLSANTLSLNGAGTVTLRFTQAGNANYSPATPVTLSFTVNPAQAIVTANNATRGFETPNPTFTYAISGLVHGDTALSGAPALTTTATLNSPAGSYPITITAGTLSAPSYALTFVPSTLTVTGGYAQTITFLQPPNVPRAVGSITLTARASSGLPITYTVTGPANVVKSKITFTGSGTVTVTAAQSGNATFAPAYSVSRSFQVTP